MKKTSIKDIAGKLGVSSTLVSLVLNGKGDQNGISPITQKKVIEIAKKLNYKPNISARSLRIGKTESIGLIVSDISNPFYAKIAGRIERKASDSGYNLIVCSTYEDAQKEDELIQMLISRNVDGMIISSSSENGNLIGQLNESGYPVVLIDRKLPQDGLNFVSVDNIKGAYEATKYLFECGYRSPSLLLISPSHISTMRERMQGFTDAYKKQNMTISKDFIKEIRFDNIFHDTEIAVKELFLDNKRTDAFFTANNSINTACLKIFSKYNIKVPNDLALISFDDVDWFEFSAPAISAVAQPLNEIGDRAFEILMNNIKSQGEMKPVHACLNPTLIIREST